MIDDFLDIVNKIFIISEHNNINSDSSKELSDLNNLLYKMLFKIKKIQEQYKVDRDNLNLLKKLS